MKSLFSKVLLIASICVSLLCIANITAHAEDPAPSNEAPVFDLIQYIKNSRYNTAGAYALIEVQKIENPYKDTGMIGVGPSGYGELSAIEVRIIKQLSGTISLPSTIHVLDYMDFNASSGQYIIGSTPRTQIQIKRLQERWEIPDVGNYNVGGWYPVKDNNIYNADGIVLGKASDLDDLILVESGDRIPGPMDDLYALKVTRKTLLYKGQGTEPVRYAYAGDILLTIGKPDSQFVYTSVFLDNKIYQIKSSALQKMKSGEFQTKKAETNFKVGVVTSSSYIYQTTATKNKVGNVRKGAAVVLVAKKADYYKILTQDGFGYVLKSNID